MTTPDDGDPLQQPSQWVPDSSLYVQNTRITTGDKSLETSTTSLPIRTSSPNPSSRATTLAGVIRSESPGGNRSLSLSRLGRSSATSTLVNTTDGDSDIRGLIVRAFSPTVAIYASDDTDEFARYKGFKDGLVDLLRPYGERVMGKVVVRDSVGASRAWDDFGIHFADLAHLVGDAVDPPTNAVEKLEELLERSLDIHHDVDEDDWIHDKPSSPLTPLYRLFLGHLLCANQIGPHEAFRHPAACVIAISSHTPNPIETLRTLYAQTAHGNRTLPMYVNSEYLRYYLLIHDEEHSDSAKTFNLFDQMKRHFGLHCHLLRLRSTICYPDDEEAEPVPRCERLSPAEALNHMHRATTLLDLDQSTIPHIFSADAQAIRNFVRELTTQSVVPHMETRIAQWNEQIASRRRGITGRLATFSKRWAGFGSGGSSRNASSTSVGATASTQSGNYDPIQGIYRYDTPEAQLRKMGDYSFMLRDFKLASSTHELLRTDFGNDKAWKYLAGANEMGVISTLLNPLAAAGAKGLKVSEYEAMLETASYSYLSRARDPTAALRAVVVAIELLGVRGRAAAEMASRWAIRCLEWNILGSVGHILLSERVVTCLHAVGDVIGGGKSWGWGRRKRKAALWSVMIAEQWMKMGQIEHAAKWLEEADTFYDDVSADQRTKLGGPGWMGFREMRDFAGQLQSTVRIKRGQARRRGLSEVERTRLDEALAQDADEQRIGRRSVEAVPEEPEQLDTRPHRRSLIMGPAGGISGMNPLETAVPLSPVRSRPDPSFSSPPLEAAADDDFE